MKSKYIVSACILVLCSCMARNDKDGRANQSPFEMQVGNIRVAAKLMSPVSNGKDSLKNKEMVCFNVKVQQPEAAFDKAKLLYLNFDMQQDFVLQANNDSLPSIFCQRIENGSPESFEYIVAFEQPVEAQLQGCTLVYNDKIFGIGTVAFAYNANDIKKVYTKR